MIRLHLVRQVQVSHCDVEAQYKSLDVELPELEKLLDAAPNGYGSAWSFLGIERLAKAEALEALRESEEDR